MSDQADDSLNWPLLALAGVIALVLSGVLAIAVGTARSHGVAAPVAGAPVTLPVMPSGPMALLLTVRTGAPTLAPEDGQALVELADRLRADPALSIGLSGAAGPVRAVQHALEANGLAAQRITVEPDVDQPAGQVTLHVR